MAPCKTASAESLCTGAARAGNFKAQYRLGMLYSAGELLPRDDAKARIYLSMAAGRCQGRHCAPGHARQVGVRAHALSAG
ncbi:hypothetical protein [Methylibium sp.]|uniref:hypothetical protein n=1 Tax=Methylibium sp. TaxID=2067992 RepID=UPI00345C17FE